MRSSNAYASPGAEESRHPFPGLRPFEPDEDYLFFGRERQTDELLRKLRTTRFLSILGTSGSGKSSLVRSGLIPALYGGAMTKAGSRWRVAIMRPGEDPLGNLAEALSAPEALGSEEDDAELTRAFFETALRASKLGLIDCFRNARAAAGDNLLVLVDQFEELFRYKHSRRVAGRDEALAFVKLLLAARSSDMPCYIALTMRSDFIGDCMEFGTLPEIINQGIYLVPRMTRDELREAITGPVAVGGGTIAPRLVSRLLNDVGDDPDQLPILQHALMRTWDFWKEDRASGEALDLRHYEAVGTMRSALSRHAEEAFAELDARGREIAEKLFKALTDKGADVRGVRRPASVGEVRALAAASFEDLSNVVEIFRKPGRSFLMPPPNVRLDDDSILDISHESLMRVWERMTTWVGEEAKSAQIYLNVAADAARYEEGSGGLWRDPELQFALNWQKSEQPTQHWAARYDPAFPRAMAFLESSRKERDRERRERETRRRTAIIVLSVASLLLAALGVYAFVQKQQAQKEAIAAGVARKEAEDALKQARKDRETALRQEMAANAARSRALIAQTEAIKQSREAEKNSALAEEQRLLAVRNQAKAEASAHEAEIAETKSAAAAVVANKARAEADTQRAKAETSATESRRLSNVAAARALALKIIQEKKPAEAAQLALEAYRLHRDNGGAEDDRDIFAAMRAAYDLATENANVLRGAPEGLRALAVAPDGRTALAAGRDGTILRVDLRERAKAVPLASTGLGIYSLAVRRQGDLVAIGTESGQVQIRDLRNPSVSVRELAAGVKPVSAVAFDPSGSRLAAGTLDGVLQVWDLDRPDAPVTLERGSNRVTALAFGSGGALAAGFGDRARVYREFKEGGAAASSDCEGIAVRSVALSPDAKTLVCGGARGEIVDGEGKKLGQHASSVNSLSFGPGGRYLASASSDGTIRLWSHRDPKALPIELRGHEGWVWAVAFTPDGQRIVSASEDRSVRLWAGRASVLAADLCELTKGARIPEPAWRTYMPDVPYRNQSPCSGGNAQ